MSERTLYPNTQEPDREPWRHQKAAESCPGPPVSAVGGGVPAVERGEEELSLLSQRMPVGVEGQCVL